MAPPPPPASAPILALPPLSPRARQLTPNLLPASIAHSGPIAVSARHWQPRAHRATTTTTTTAGPSAADAGALESAFRGRRLVGRAVALPEGYAGVVVQRGEEAVVVVAEEEEEEEEEEEGEEVEVRQTRAVAGFDRVVVWGHEAAPDAREDVYVRGLREWVALAETMNGYGAVRDGR